MLKDMMMQTSLRDIWLLLVLPIIVSGQDQLVALCEWEGIALKGRVQVVESFPDIKVQVVDAFPDLKVESVRAFPNACGKWQFVESFPDFKIQYVDSFPDLKIKFVSSFPGVVD